MDITWLGHSSVKIQTNKTTLVTDPYPNSIGVTMSPTDPDIVTMSNNHPNHSHRNDLNGNPKFIVGPGEYEIGGFYITGMATELKTEETERRVNTVFSYQAESLTLCHLGDLSQLPSTADLRTLSNTDVLFVPAGGNCTIEVEPLAELVNKIQPRIVVPIHYHFDGLAIELNPVEKFLSSLGVSETKYQPKLNVTANNLPLDLRVVLLERS